jgi:predicted amidophosphoribosyltransferase
MRPERDWVEHHTYKLDAACNWSPWVKSLVYGYKFYGRQDNQRLLVDLLSERANRILAEYLSALTGYTVWVVPIPAHTPERTHAQKLAKALSYRLEGGLYQPILQWQRVAKEQHHLGSAAARRHNLRGAFGLKPAEIRQSKTPDLILIIDDLMTTGSTMKEAIQTLQSRYACIIVGLSVMNVPYEGRRSQIVNELNPVSSKFDGKDGHLSGLLFDDEAPEWVLPKLS